jgi:hypothetical protein
VVVFSFVLEVVVEGFLFHYFSLCVLGFDLVRGCVAEFFWLWADGLCVTSCLWGMLCVLGWRRFGGGCLLVVGFEAGSVYNCGFSLVEGGGVCGLRVVKQQKPQPTLHRFRDRAICASAFK